MSSRRFPGKMLAPLAGRPMVDWVLERIAHSVGRERLVLATSADPTDLPLALYAQHKGYQVFRGDLDNVFVRFQDCVDRHPADWIVRVSGDSPLLDTGLIGMLFACCQPGLDLVTNVAERTFPPGQSVEIINAATLKSIDAASLGPEEIEHVTQVFYRNPERYRIRNITATNPQWRTASFVVDTLDDLIRLEAIAREGRLPIFSGASAG